MNAIELLEIIGTGETSKVQFKQELPHRDSVAQEIVAMSNSLGGVILLGVKDVTGEVTGLSPEQVESYDKVISEIGDNIKPPVYLTTEVIKVVGNNAGKNVLIAHVQEGVNKPYKTAKGEIYVKQGSNKRLLTDNAEIMRLFQQSGIMYLDEMIIPRTSIDDVAMTTVEDYIRIIQKRKTDEKIEITENLLNNLNIIKKGRLTLGGLLFFAKHPQKYRPAFCVKAISFFGNSIGGKDYRSSKDIEGTIPEMFEETMSFFRSNLHHIQDGQNFNKVGKLEVAQTALEELLQNALVHRDYSKNSPVRVMIFDNRLEIVSPGCLPNSLTVENIKLGNAVVRNNLLVTYCSKMLIYRGFGSGITRALEDQPNIELINDANGEQFIVNIPRPKNN